ncbi:MAG: hypothetical protein KGL39_12160 [Patescibacteria group bacterium]|nr:hypothetical protein [Patescibacteria group bacterium]
MSTPTLTSRPIQRDNLTLQEAAEQLHISPSKLDVSRFPHAWRFSHNGSWRVPWCCLRSVGQQDEQTHPRRLFFEVDG